jgi:hypothetical protein
MRCSSKTRFSIQGDQENGRHFEAGKAGVIHEMKENKMKKRKRSWRRRRKNKNRKKKRSVLEK